MLLLSITSFFKLYFYAWLNLWSFGFIGVFYLIVNFLLVNIFILWWKFYYLWVYEVWVEYFSFLWVDYFNNILIFFNLKFDFFNVICSLVMLTGGMFVMNFIFIELWDDKEGSCFLITLGIFVSFMLILINSNDLIVFYFGWEGISITSLFLVHFWSERARSFKAAFKVFVINKLGDFFIMILFCILFFFIGNMNFSVINSLSLLLLNTKYYLGSFIINLQELLGILIILGGSVKSAQVGFHIWLLEAMEAPLGASALMHSSTLVIAGLVLIYKLIILVELSCYAQLLMYFLGVFSAFLGALFACFQFELKVIMAYSTISNMGYIFILCSLGLYDYMILALVLHAYIKIFLFLMVGSVMLHCNGCQDVRYFGLLFSYASYLYIFFFLGVITLAGFPYFSGYYYKFFLWKEANLCLPLISFGRYILFGSFFLTYIYSFRCLFLIFFGSKNGHFSIYKLKNVSLLYILSIFVLGCVIMHNSYFWVNLIETNLNLLTTDIVYLTKLGWFYTCSKISYSIYYIWINLYLIFYFFIFSYITFILKNDWLFIKYFNINFCIINILYLCFC